jgi:hypothetical protein
MAQVDPKRLARYKAEHEAQEQRKAARKTFTKVDLLQPPKNVEVLLRILPGQEPGSVDKDYYVEVWQHFKVSTTAKFPVTCPRTLDQDAECPICAKVRQLYSTKNPQDKKSADDMRAKPRYMMGVIPLSGFADDILNKVVVWPAPQQVKLRVEALFNNPDWGDVTHPLEGYDCRLTVTGVDRNTTYTLDPVKTPSPLDDDPAVVDLILSAQPALYKYRFAAPVEQLRKFMLGETNTLTQHVDPSEVVAPDDVVPDEEESVFSQVEASPSAPAPVTTTESREAPVTVHAQVSPPTPAPVPVTPPVAAPAKRGKFDVSAIKAQVAAIKPAVK